MITIEPNIRGLIFDWDGTLVDTMPLHYRAWQDVIREHGGDFPEELFYQLAGVPSEDIVRILNDKFGCQLSPIEITRQKEDLFMEKYLPQAKPIESIFAVAQAHKGRLPMAVATGGLSRVINNALQSVGLSGFFDAVVTADDVKHGKPAPDTFLEAARRIQVEPAYCQVFEDAEAGLEGARRAGMVVTDVRPWRKL